MRRRLRKEKKVQPLEKRRLQRLKLKLLLRLSPKQPRRMKTMPVLKLWQLELYTGRDLFNLLESTRKVLRMNKWIVLTSTLELMKLVIYNNNQTN